MSKPKIESYVPVVALILCTFLSSSMVLDATLTIRQIAWMAAAIALIILIVRRSIIGDVDIGGLFEIPFVLMVALLIFMAASCIFAVNASQSYVPIARFTAFAIFTAGCVLVIKDEGGMVCRTAMVLSLVVAGYAMWQLFTREGFLAVQGWQSNRNLCCSAIFLLGMLGLCGKGKRSPVEIAAFLCVAAVLIVLANRTVLLAMTVSGLVLATKSVKWFAITTMCIIIALAGAWYLRPRTFNAESLRARINLWNVSFAMASDMPVLGAGPGNWRLMYPEYATNGFTGSADKHGKTTVYQNIFYQRAHNDFLSMFAECGIAAALCYVGIFVFALKSAWRRRTLSAGILGYCVIAMFSFPAERACQSIILCLMIALSVKHRRTKLIRTQHAYIAGMAGLAILIPGLIAFTTAYSNECRMRQVASACMNGKSLEVLEKTEGLNCIDPLSAPMSYYRGHANMLLKRYGEAVSDYEAGLRQTPNHVYLLFESGEAYCATGKTDLAAQCYHKALKLNPDFEIAASRLKTIEGMTK